jgi:hypothetical protein
LYKPFLVKTLSLDSYKFASFTQKSFNPLQEDSGYIAGFSNEEKSHIFTLVSIEFISPQTGEKQIKKFVLMSSAQDDVSSDILELHAWLKQYVALREY